MSRLVSAIHKAPVLLASLTGLALLAGSIQKIDINQGGAYERFSYRLKTKVSAGETAPANPKFGGIYNLIKSSKIVRNNDTAARALMPAKFLYADTFNRSGRELNTFPYHDPTANGGEHVQTIHHAFGGRNTALRGRIEANAAFALDLRYTNAGSGTFSSVELHLELGSLADVYEQVGDLSLDVFEIEVWGVEIINTPQSELALGLISQTGQRVRYAEMINQYDYETNIVDVTKTVDFNLPSVGVPNDNIWLSDVTVLQLDEAGLPVAFDDDNARVVITVNGLEYSSTPIWQIKEQQNAVRLEEVPPNQLNINFNAAGGIFGGLGPNQLFNNAKISIIPNVVEGQTGKTCLEVQKCYSAKV